MDRTITILQHEISYWYGEDQEMPDHEQEHIKEMIIEGFSSGQIVDVNENSENVGWWRIS